jgi:16S rRNA (guanine527-N7)-methyltransferase
MSFITILDNAMKEFGFILSEKQRHAFYKYFRTLLEWNEKMNLTAITAADEVAIKHMVDSLSCLDERVFPVGCSVVDVGTGAGFPGIPLKIYREDISLTLLDSLNKRLNFLQAVIDELAIQKVRLVHSRAEDGARKRELRESYDVAVSRAVARLNLLCEFCLPFVRVGGYFIAMKGAQTELEIHEAKNALAVLGGEITEVRSIKLPGLMDSRAVIFVKKVRATPLTFPRRAGLPEKKPL